MKDRATILVSIGEIAVAVKEYPNEFLQYVKPVMIEVTLVLSQAARSNKEHTTLQTVTSSVSTKVSFKYSNFKHLTIIREKAIRKTCKRGEA